MYLILFECQRGFITHSKISISKRKILHANAKEHARLTTYTIKELETIIKYGLIPWRTHYLKKKHFMKVNVTAINDDRSNKVHKTNNGPLLRLSAIKIPRR